MASGQRKATDLETMLKNFRQGFSGDYGVKLNPGKLQPFCEAEWPAFGIRWPSEGILDVPTVWRAWNAVTGSPGYPDQFPYIDSWLDIAQRLPPWLWFTCNRQGQAKVLLASSKRRGTDKKKATETSEGSPPPYVPPPPTTPRLPETPPPSASRPPKAPTPKDASSQGPAQPPADGPTCLLQRNGTLEK